MIIEAVLAGSAAQIRTPAAEHMTRLLALAVGDELTTHDLLAMLFHHPVLEEGLRTALHEIAEKSVLSRPGRSACSAPIG